MATTYYFGPVVVVSAAPPGLPPGFTYYIGLMTPFFSGTVISATAEPFVQPGKFSNTNWEVFRIYRQVINPGGDQIVEVGVRNLGPNPSNFFLNVAVVVP